VWGADFRVSALFFGLLVKALLPACAGLIRPARPSTSNGYSPKKQAHEAISLVATGHFSRRLSDRYGKRRNKRWRQPMMIKYKGFLLMEHLGERRHENGDGRTKFIRSFL